MMYLHVRTSLKTTLKSVLITNFFLIRNGILSTYFLFTYNHINNIPDLFGQNICFLYLNEQSICCNGNFTALVFKVGNVSICLFIVFLINWLYLVGFGLKLQWPFLSVQLYVKKTTKTCNILF